MADKVLRSLSACLLAGALQAASAQTTLELATELVEAARFDYSALMSVQVAVQRELANGKVAADKADCVARAPSQPFTPALARYFASQMSPAELNTAIQFYSTALGRKYTAQAIHQAQRKFGMKPDTVEQRFSAPELKVVQTFAQSAGGRKLFEGNLERSAVLSPDSRAVAQGILQACGLRN